MRIELNKYQRGVLFIAATIIIIIQILQFNDEGFYGYGWVFSFFAATILVVLGLSKYSKNEVMKNKVPEIKPSSKEELGVIHVGHRKNTEILSIEIEKRAMNLANSFTSGTDSTFGGLFNIIDEGKGTGDIIIEMMKIQVMERCLYLMLGLVGMRRSKGNNVYIKGIEYKTLQEIITKKIIKLNITSQTLLGVPTENNPVTPTKNYMPEILEIQKAINSYCFSIKLGKIEPESSIINWFESRSGYNVRGNPQISQALNGEKMVEVKRPKQSRSTARFIPRRR